MEASESNGGGVLNAITTATAAVIAVGTLISQKLNEDGTLAAAGRQGLDELGNALVAFPPGTAHATESGTIWNPTQGEIAADRRHTEYGNWQSSRPPSPSEIGRELEGSGGGNGPGSRSPSSEHAQLEEPGKSWTEKVGGQKNDGQADNSSDGYERGRGRSLPDEQRDQERGR